MVTSSNRIEFPIDPIGLGVSSQETLDLIASFNLENANIVAQLDQTGEKAKKTSRQIGEYKRNKRDISALKDKMQTISITKKELLGTLKDLQIKAHSLVATFQCSPPEKNLQLNSDSLPDLFSCPALFSKASDTVPYSIREAITTEDIGAWEKYVDNNQRCSTYHRYKVRHLIESTMGHRCIYLLATNENNETVGVLPSVQLNSKLFGNLLVSLPFFNYGGAVGNSEGIETALIQALIAKATPLGVETIDFRDTKERTSLPSRQHKISMLLHLPTDKDTLWGSVGTKVRAQIKKARSFDTSLKIGGRELAKDFYYVFSRNMRDLGTPVHGENFFSQLLSMVDIDAHFVIGYLKEQPVSCAVLIGHGNTLEIPWASTLRSANPYNANMYLYWEVLSFAIEKQYQYFDFGRSSKDASTFKFKKQWGAKPYQLHWHYWKPDKETLSEINPNNPKYKLFISMWKLLPLCVCNFLGPKIVKFIP